MKHPELNEITKEALYSPAYELVRIAVICLIVMMNFAVSIIDFIQDDDAT